MDDASPLERLLKRDRFVTIAGLLALCVFAWLYIVAGAGLGMNAWEMTRLALFPHLQSAGMTAEMPGMDMSGMDMDMPGMDMATGQRTWGPTIWALMIAMWWIMMVAMMSPSAAPTVLLYARVHRHALAQGQVQDKLAPSGVFVAGYLMVWLGFSVAAAALYWLLERTAIVSATTMSSQSRWLSGIILIAAGLYQLSPLKNACLALPDADGLPFPPLASSRIRGAASGRAARGLLRRVLLDADGVVVRGWRHEPGVDRRARHSGAG